MEPLVTREPNAAGEKTLVRDISWCGVFNGANACMVDVKDGKIIRIRPARYYDQYTKEEVKPWVMHARGKTFEPSDKSLVPPLSLAYKKRVFSPGRIRLPHEASRLRSQRRPRLCRPGGPQPAEPGREQVRAHQLGRSPRHHHERDAARQRDLRSHRHPLPVRPARREQGGPRSPRLHAASSSPVRRLHPAGARRRQLGGLVVGRQARLGLRAGRAADAAEESALRHLQERRAAPASGAAIRRPPRGGGRASSPAA